MLKKKRSKSGNAAEKKLANQPRLHLKHFQTQK